MKYHPDLRELFRTLHPRLRTAAVSAQRALEDLGVKCALVGGFAVGAYGHARATKDVDFLVDEVAFASLDPVMTFAPGVPYRVGDVPVDLLLADRAWLRSALAKAERDPETGLRVLPAEALVAMKLEANRAKDRADVLEIIATGVEARDVVRYLDHFGLDELKSRLERLLKDD